MKLGPTLRAFGRLSVRVLSPRSTSGSIILPIVIVTVICGAIGATVSTNFMTGSAAQSAEIRLDGVATVAADQIGGLLARSLSDAASLSQDPIIMSTQTTTEEKLAEMKRIQSFSGMFEDITLIDLDGNTITSTDHIYNGEWASDPLFQSAAKGTASMSDTILQLNPYAVVIKIACPVVSADQRIISVLAAQVDMEYIWQVIDRTKFGKTGYVCLIDKAGNIIAGPQQNGLSGKIAFYSEDSGLPAEHELIRYNDGSGDMTAVVAAISPRVPWAGNKWLFVGILPAAEAFAPVREVQTLFLVTILLLLMIFLLVGLVLGHNLSGKIKALADGTAEIERGNLRHRLPHLQPKELGHLAKSFNSMAARLETSASEIARWNTHLEEQINAKTRELDKVMAGKLQSERLSAMGYIATSVAHELNDPLTAVSGYAQLGIKELQKAQTSEDMSKNMENASNYFKNIDKELQRSKNIIGKLISFVRYSRAKEGPVDINQVIGDTLAIVSHHLKINKVEVTTQLQPDIPPVLGNAQQLQQVFLNILLNAQMAMPQGGKLQVETRHHKENGKSNVEVILADTGGGIPPDKLSKIFEPPFTIFAEKPKPESDLSVSKDIIKQHGGEITVKSEMGLGTKFIISLPAANGSPAELSGSHTPKRRRGEQ